MKKSVLQEVQARIASIQQKRAAELAEIREKQAEARTQIEAASLAMKEATEVLNVEAYEKARNDKKKWQTALDMYNARFNQIQAQELVTEADSDSVINSLLAYEEEIAQTFKQAMKDPLQILKKLLDDYEDEVQEVENTINIWQTDIHANYSTRGSASFVNPDTGERTDRSAVPVPVHRLPYTGCSEATQLKTYLEKAL